jgi:hypothetical protein
VARVAPKLVVTKRPTNRVPLRVPVAVADEQAHGEEDDQRRDGRLRAALDDTREIRLEEQDRNAEEDERQRLSESPPHAECGRAPAGVVAAGRHQRRHGGDVVGIGGVGGPNRNGPQVELEVCSL